MMALTNILISITDVLVPIYTLVAIISILLFVRNEKFAKLNKEVRNAVYHYVKPVSANEESQDPDAWKRKFTGNFTLLRREGIKEVSISFPLDVSLLNLSMLYFSFWLVKGFRA